MLGFEAKQHQKRAGRGSFVTSQIIKAKKQLPISAELRLWLLPKLAS